MTSTNGDAYYMEYEDELTYENYNLLKNLLPKVNNAAVKERSVFFFGLLMELDFVLGPFVHTRP